MRQIFRTQGSQDEEDVQTTGFEIFQVLKFFENKFLLFLCILISIANGILPVLMNLIMGDMTSTFAKIETETVPHALTPFILKMTYINIAMLVLMALMITTRSVTTPKFTVDIRRAIFTSLMNQKRQYIH